MKDLTEQIQYMHRFFHTRKTWDISLRRFYLKKLKTQILAHESQILSALYQDLKKPAAETYRTELIMVLEELTYTLKHLSTWTKPKIKPATFPMLGGFTKQLAEPYGVCAIYVPFNYPFQLAMTPLIGALAAGNCTVLKLSEYTPHTNRIITQIIHATFPSHLVYVLVGDAVAAQNLLKQPLDYIFFTGSTEVGKQVMKSAAEHLIPVTLELGGKNPTIVDYSADLKLAAKRIAWGKYMNAGQTCVAPDYILVHESVADAFIKELKDATQTLYPPQAPMAHIINESHFVRLIRCINEDKVVIGGHFDNNTLYMEPTILYPASLQDSCMQDEIFGPILPVIPFGKLSNVFQTINRFPKPLACYIFSEDQTRIKHMLRHISFGGGCINDTVMHLTDPKLPFGGVGYSGQGAYHGYASFKTFSHFKSLLSSPKLDIPMRYGYAPSDVKALRSYLHFKFKD
ncbi:MAG: aldehyde dehydrogenase family protein [Cellulosilyticaceae bacterium]